MPCWDVEGGEDVFGFGGQGIGGCEVVAVEGDGDVLEVAGYGQGGLVQGGVTGVDGGQNECP